MITIGTVCQRLGGGGDDGGKPLSKVTVYRMIAAAKADADIRAGKITHDDIPKDILRYLGMGFPIPFYVTPRNPRWDSHVIDTWISNSCRGNYETA